MIYPIATMLARAFYHSPFYRYIMPTDSRRLAQLSWWMSCMVRYSIRYGLLCTTPGTVDGAALWLTPTAPYLKTPQLLFSGFALAPLWIGISDSKRLLEISSEWEDLHREEQYPHWYLLIIGVEPARQGQGVGSRLIQSVLTQADRDRLPCYLETTNEHNLAFYQKHGFEIVVHRAHRQRLNYWTMRRSPRGMADVGTP